MEPATILGLANVASGLFKSGIAADSRPAPNQNAYGGVADGKNSGGAAGGAYGGAFSQSTVDGSNWTVSMGGNATGGGKSGGNGGLSPTQSMTSPQNPFQGITNTMADSVGAAGSGSLLLVGLAMLAFFVLKK